MGYIGNTPALKYASFAVQHFTTSATTTYSLDNPVANENEIALFINNVRQEPGSSYAYTASGTTLTLSAATSASDTMYCVFIGKAVQTVTPTLPIANFSSTGIDDNATSTAITIDSSQNVGIGTSSPSAQLHIQGSDITDQIIIENTNSGAETAPDLTLYRNSSSPADSDTLGNIIFRGRNDNSEDINYFEITAVAKDVSDGTEDTQVEFATKAGGSNSTIMTFVSDKVGIGTSSPNGILELKSTGNTNFFITAGNTSASQIVLGDTDDIDVGKIAYSHNVNSMEFIVNASERMRIENSGSLLINKTINNFSTAGVILNSGGNCFFTASGNSGVNVNRLSDDGALVRFYQANSEEGSISVSGSTVSYNGFTGTHWSRLSDNSKPTILKGTILESLDEMMDWYQVQFDITETDDEGNETTRTEKQSYALGDGENVGDVITYDFDTGKQDDEGNDIIEEVQATIIQEGDVKHTKSKISDTVDAKNVYGVFVAWDNDDDTVNDMYVAQTGTFVVRINGSETVSKGDLIQSNGDGTGKVQADDLLRASTVAKVLSTTKIETYDDGSYIVPCSLHC